MLSEYSLRCFVTALFCAAMLFNFAPQAIAKSQECEKGQIVRNGWRARWSAEDVSVAGEKEADITSYADDARYYYNYMSEKKEQADASKFLNIRITTPIRNSALVLWIVPTPVFFETNSARYDARFGKDYSNTGIYRTPITDGASGMADIRVTLRRQGVQGLYTNVTEWGATFSMTEDFVQRFLGEGASPLVVEFSADGRPLLSRTHDVNGLLRVYQEALPYHMKQKSRKEAGICGGW